MRKRNIYALPAHNADISFRTLTECDARAFRTLRLEALATADGNNFATDIEIEKAYTLKQWREACRETKDKAILGAYDGDKLIGSMSVFRWDRDHTGKTAYYRSAYVRPSHRNRSIVMRLANTRDIWALKHGCVKAAGAIRDTNEHWLKTQIDLGARIIGETYMRYTDGEYALTFVFERSLNGINKIVLPARETQYQTISAKDIALHAVA